MGKCAESFLRANMLISHSLIFKQFMTVQRTLDAHSLDTPIATKRVYLHAIMHPEIYKDIKFTNVVKRQVDVYMAVIQAIQLSVMLMSQLIPIKFIDEI